MSKKDLMPPWQKGQSGNPKGRPKGSGISDVEKHLTRIFGKKKARAILGKNLNKEDFSKWRILLMSLSSEDAKTLAKDEDIPLYARTKLFGSINDMKNGKTVTQDNMYEDEFGKVAQKMEITGKDGESLDRNFVVSVVRTKEDLEEFRKRNMHGNSTNDSVSHG